MSDIQMGTLYDLNKAGIIELEKEISKEEMPDKLKTIGNFIRNANNQYFMLLCRERYDFTLFNLQSATDLSIIKAKIELETCMRNRGTVLSIEPTEDKGAIEIWIKIDDEAFVYYFFPYDLGVIEIK